MAALLLVTITFVLFTKIYISKNNIKMPGGDTEDGLFALHIGDIAQSHLLSIAKWNKFVAVAGISVCVIVILVLIGYVLNCVLLQLIYILGRTSWR